MKKILIAAGIILITVAASGQVLITSLSPTGRLSWTNLATPSPLPAIYKVEWAPTPNGTPTGFLRVTNQSQVNLPNFPGTGPSPAFYRLIWESGQLWSLNIYGDFGLLATGRFYISSPNAPVVRGRYDLRVIVGPGGSAPQALYNPGTLTSGPSENDTGNFRLNFVPDGFFFAEVPPFWIEGPVPVSNTWTGTWTEGDPFGVGSWGTFEAQRIVRGN